jgi:hypothetical protein
MSKTQEFTEVLLVSAALVHKDRQTDRHDINNSCILLPLPSGPKVIFFIDAFAKLLAVLYRSVRVSVWYNSTPTGQLQELPHALVLA